MKTLLQILILLILASCQTIDKADNHKFCDKEIELLKGNSSFAVQFDFNLKKVQQIENLQRQVNKSFCSGVIPLNGEFIMGDHLIETLLTIDWYCIDSTNHLDAMPPARVLVHSKQVIINSNKQILIDGNLTKEDSISNSISNLSKDFFGDNSFKLVAYEVKWAEETDNNIKFNVFKEIIKGYLKAANQISMEEFNTNLCELDSVKLNELKRKFRFTFFIDNELPTPPPPPDDLLELEVDSIELN